MLGHAGKTLTVMGISGLCIYAQIPARTLRNNKGVYPWSAKISFAVPKAIQVIE